MNKTLFRESNEQITVDIEKLSAMLSCGRATARKIGEQAEARICITISQAERMLGRKWSGTHWQLAAELLHQKIKKWCSNGVVEAYNR